MFGGAPQRLIRQAATVRRARIAGSAKEGGVGGESTAREEPSPARPASRVRASRRRAPDRRASRRAPRSRSRSPRARARRRSSTATGRSRASSCASGSAELRAIEGFGPAPARAGQGRGASRPICACSASATCRPSRARPRRGGAARVPRRVCGTRRARSSSTMRRFERAYAELESVLYENTVVNDRAGALARAFSSRTSAGSSGPGSRSRAATLRGSARGGVGAGPRASGSPNTPDRADVSRRRRQNPPPLTSARLVLPEAADDAAAVQARRRRARTDGLVAARRRAAGSRFRSASAGRPRAGEYWLEAAEREELVELFELVRSRPARRRAAALGAVALRDGLRPAARARRAVRPSARARAPCSTATRHEPGRHLHPARRALRGARASGRGWRRRSSRRSRSSAC